MSEMTIQNAVEAFNATTTKLAKDLTKRELFAAMAMQAYAMDQVPEKAAKLAVEYADSLLAELAKEKKE